MPDVPTALGWALRAWVPEGALTLAVEADDATAAAEHAAFAGRCLPVLTTLQEPAPDESQTAEDPEQLRAGIAAQLATLRQAVSGTGLGYLGVLTGEHEGRPAMILLGIAGTPQAFPDSIDPASLMAAMLKEQYPGAAVEEFTTDTGVGVGIRRCESYPLPSGEQALNAGVSQALVPFPEATLLATVTGLSFPAEAIDVATVFTATMAYRLSLVQHTRPPDSDGESQ
jgi:hypothetical protein